MAGALTSVLSADCPELPWSTTTSANMLDAEELALKLGCLVERERCIAEHSEDLVGKLAALRRKGDGVAPMNAIADVHLDRSTTVQIKLLQARSEEANLRSHDPELKVGRRHDLRATRLKGG